MMNRPNKREYQRLLVKYLEGKCSPKEREAIDRWYESFDDDGKNSIDADFSDIDDSLGLKSEMFRNIEKGIEEQEASLNVQPLITPRRNLAFIRLKRLVAVVVAGIGIGVAIFSQTLFNRNRQASNETVTERLATDRPRVGGPATIYLPDGSVVWLRNRSWLEYPGEFENAMREVTLRGEAFFDVAKDNNRPFVIHSTNFTTRVLGTTFKIKDRDDEDSQEVEVVTGKVIVSVKGTITDSAQELVLKPKRKAVYSRKNNSLIEASVEEEHAASISAKSKLEFNEVALTDIIRVLNVVYGVNITIASEDMTNCIITADLTNETLEVSVAILAKAINADFTMSGKDIILSGGGCPLAD